MRKKWWFSVAVFLLLFVIGLLQGVFLFSDLWMLPSYTALGENSLCLFLWVFVGLLWAEAFPVRMIYSPRVTAFLLGMCLGEMALPFLVSKAVSDKRQRGSAIFAGMGGAVLLPFGDLGHFGFGVPSESLYLLPLIALLSTVASGTEEIQWQEPEKATGLPYLLGALMSLSLWLAPEKQTLILGAVALGLSLLNKAIAKIGRGVVIAIVFSFASVILCTAGGIPELFAWSIEEAQFMYASYLTPFIVLTTALSSALLGEWNMVLIGQAIQERALDVQKQEIWTSFAIGTAIGGVSPFIFANAWRENWKRILVLMGGLLLLLCILV